MLGKLGRKSLSSKKDILTFIDVYARDDNWHEIDRKKGDLGFGWVHYAIIRNFKPSRVLVIGSKYGFVPAICALACRDNGRGRVDFVDAGLDYRNPKETNQWGGVGFWKKVDEKKHFGKFDLNKFISTFVMTSDVFSKKCPQRRWGYINIDGDHSYKGVKFDFSTFWPKLNGGGLVSLHDIYTKDTKELKYGVSKFWQELREVYRDSIEIPGKYGLGIIQKN